MGALGGQGMGPLGKACPSGSGRKLCITRRKWIRRRWPRPGGPMGGMCLILMMMPIPRRPKGFFLGENFGFD